MRAGHFLTDLDRQYLLEGPEPKQTTKRTYRGRRIERERRKHMVAYRRVVRKAHQKARGALADLAFLAEVMEPEWLYDAFTETRPLHPPTEAEMPEKFQRETVMRMGRSEAPLESLVRRLSARIGFEKWLVSDYKEGQPVNTGRRGAFVAVRLIRAIEQGLNDAGGGHQSHRVSLVTQQGEAEAPWASGVPRIGRGRL